MKYYKNLIKNKNYKGIIGSIIFLALGCLCVYINFQNILEEGIQNNGLSYGITLGIFWIDIISKSNWGLVIIGLINIYTGLIFAPRNYEGSQDDEDYEIKSIEDSIYIKYKNREFLVNKEKFGPTDLFFKDKNGKFVSMATGYQIYNYVMSKHKDKTEKEISEGFIVKQEEIVNKFSNIRLINDEEINSFITSKKLKYRRKIISFLLCLIFYALSGFFTFGAVSSILLSQTEDLFRMILLGVVFFGIGKFCDKTSKREIDFIDKVKKGNTYIADCYSYDKKIKEYNERTVYLIKVTDNNGHFINEWLEIPQKIYKNNEIVTAKLIVIGEDGKELHLLAE